jgi:hypothetical protein
MRLSCPVVLLAACGSQGLDTLDPRDEVGAVGDTSAVTGDGGDSDDGSSGGDGGSGGGGSDSGTTGDGGGGDGGEDSGGGESAGGTGLYVLRGGATEWEVADLAPTADPYAPTSPVRAAFSLHPQRQVWVLTASLVHVLDVDSLSWIDTHLVRSVFPEVDGTSVTAAVDVQGTDDDTSVTLQSDDTAWLYTYDGSAGEMVFERSTGFGDDWSDPQAPAPADVTAAWVALDNDLGWVDGGDPSGECGASAADVGPYLAVLDNRGQVHLYDAGYCFGFYDVVSGPELGIFGLPGAPDPSSIDAAAWTGQMLVVVAE